MRQWTWYRSSGSAAEASPGGPPVLPTPRWHPDVATVAAVAVVLAIAAVPVDARDRVVLQPPDRASVQTISGDIADYTAEVIEIHLTVGKPVHVYPAAQVLSVETVQTEAHREGVRLFASGDLTAAEERLSQALSDEPRQWVQREILGWLVKIALRRGDLVVAGRRFLQITSQESAPREYALAPLVWGAVAAHSNVRQHGRLWLTGMSDVERLLGASMLLLDPQYAEVAKGELDRLARVADARVAALARTQLWRLRISSPDVTDNELTRWEESIAHLPAELRAGPYYLLARAATQRSEYDRAAAAFLWLPTVYRENEPLAAEAAIGAATALKRIGRLHEARLLLTEITTDFSWSPTASEAKSLLSELAGES